VWVELLPYIEQDNLYRSGTIPTTAATSGEPMPRRPTSSRSCSARRTRYRTWWCKRPRRGPPPRGPGVSMG
jgi:hypothetical protein